MRIVKQWIVLSTKINYRGFMGFANQIHASVDVGIQKTVPIADRKR